MKPLSLTLRPEMPLAAAYQAFLEHAVREAPVLDGEERLCGLLGIEDLLWHRVVSHPLQLQQGCADDEEPCVHKSVKDLMTPALGRVSHNAGVAEAAMLILAEDVQSLYVISERGVLLGTVSARDLLRFHL